MKDLLRINMGELAWRKEALEPPYHRLGGRGLSSTMISREVDPLCHPLGRHNKLIVAPGILGGTIAPCCQRVSVGAKSPLTGGIKEANSGGISGQKLGRLGVAAIAFEGIPEKNRLYVVHISNSDVQIEPADDLRGKGNYDTSQILRERYGKHVGVASIGPAGEMLMGAATIAFIDQEGVPARHAARGGLGAVMGSKGVKAIVIDDAGVPKTVTPADREVFNQTVKEFVAVIKERPRVKNRLPIYGTAGLVAFTNEVNSLPTRNFSAGQFDRIEKISGDHVVSLIDQRGGQRGHSCYAGCMIGCSNIFNDREGKHLTSSLEYETLCMLGANCDIDDVDTIAMLDRLCDDYGVDTIEIGCSIGVAMEAGVIPFGDGAKTIMALHELAQGTPFGRVIGNGVVVTGKVFGVTRVPAIKGQGLPAWDPRTALATGVTFMTSPQGADHTAGRLQGVLEFDRFKPGTIAPLSRDMQVRVCTQDSVGLCQFSDGTPESAEFIARLLSAYWAIPFTVDDVIAMGQDIFRTERHFNLLSPPIYGLRRYFLDPPLNAVQLEMCASLGFIIR